MFEHRKHIVHRRASPNRSFTNSIPQPLCGFHFGFSLVEVKRSRDLRIRREVVGQMLDYGAHAVAYWTADALRTRFEAACEQEGRDAAQLNETT